MGGAGRTLRTLGPPLAKRRAMATMRSKTKDAIDRMARGARKATDKVSDASDRNRKPSRRATTKVKAAVERVGDKIEQAGRSMKDAGQKAKRRAKATRGKTSTRARSV